MNVGIAGLGAIGTPIVKALLGGQLPGYRLAAISVKNRDRARQRMQRMGGANIPILTLAELATAADIVIESIPATHFMEVARPAIESGRVLLPMSVGALLDRLELVDRARETGAKIIIPSGALLGIDALNAAAEGEIYSVSLVTKKPPDAFLSTPYLEERGINVMAAAEKLLLFSGNACEAARAFPASANVSALLSLSGIGPQRTSVEIWADPLLECNTHEVHVTSDSSNFYFRIENTPSDENPKTGRITAQSVISTLRRQRSHFVIGT